VHELENIFYIYLLQIYLTVFSFSNGTMRRRQRGAGLVISRLAEVSPNQKERYYLRIILLHHPGGFRDYEKLLTVNGVLHATFREACIAMNLLRNDQEHVLCLQYAAVSRRSYALRNLMAYQVIFHFFSHIVLFSHHYQHVSVVLLRSDKS
jgi:hypothetical protein